MFKTLIVEDNAAFRQALIAVLSTQFPAMAIAEAEDGMGTLKQVEDFEPDLIFMDIKLKNDNGLSLAKAIKANHAGTVIIMLTAYDVPEYREAAFRSGANHFIPKGASTSREILAMVESILAGRGRR